MEEHGYVLVSRKISNTANARGDGGHGYLSQIDKFIDSLHACLWPLNTYIHENPELAFVEYKTHDALTKFMRSQKDWEVTSSAYGMETAWEAVYDSGRTGPVVSFNAEMGALSYSPFHHM
jgi:metal-dependent amidase/aminoacylase/carboxypeptidase family protein